MRYIFLIFCQAFTIMCAAQDELSTDAGGLKVGDRVPDEIWKRIPKSENNRLIILDQWSTNCTSCIRGFGKMGALQQEIGDALKVVLVTRDSDKNIETRPVIKKFLPDLPSITGDSLIYSLFPYVMVPQHIWLDQNGVVLAITDGDNATAANVRKYLESNRITLRTKNDIQDFDYKKPLFAGPYMPEEQLQFYSLLVRGKVDLKSGNTFRNLNGVVHGRLQTNTDLLSLYKIAARGIIDDFDRHRIFIEVADSSALTFDYNNPDEDRSKQYSYDLIVPVAQADQLYNYMLADLNRYTNYVGKIEKRKLTCLALVRTRKNYRIRSAENEKKANTLFYGTPPTLSNYPFSYLLLRLKGLSFIDLPVVDETNYDQPVTIEFSQSVTDFTVLQNELERYGLALKKVKRKMDVLVLSDKKAPGW